MIEESDSNKPWILIPEEGVICNSKRNGGLNWSPCGNKISGLMDKKNCNLFECPYHDIDVDDY